MTEIMSHPLYAVAVAGLLALVFAFTRSLWVNKQDEGDDTMRKIAGHIRVHR